MIAYYIKDRTNVDFKWQIIRLKSVIWKFINSREITPQNSDSKNRKYGM